MTAQLDIFGDVAAQLDEHERRAIERAQWRARFERRDFPSPYDAAGGTKTGEIVHGWVCPGCGQVEWNEHILNLNHGYDPTIPGRAPYGTEWGAGCNRLRLLDSQRTSAVAAGRLPHNDIATACYHNHHDRCPGSLRCPLCGPETRACLCGCHGDPE